MQYKVSGKTGRHFEISDERMQPLGAMLVNFWQPGKAQISATDGNVYNIAGVGFWQTTKVINKNGIRYAELIPKAARGFILGFENGSKLLIQRKSLWNSGDFIVTDEAGNNIASIYSNFSWKTFGFSYDIEVNTGMLDKELKFVLPFILIYSVRLTRIRSAG